MHGLWRRRAWRSGVIVLAGLAIPSVVLAANVTVGAIPGNGWVQSPDNAGGAAAIVDGPNGGLGGDSVQLTTAGMSDFIGFSRQVLGPLSDVTGASWLTYATGTSSNLVAEPASLRFTMYRLGGTSEFTTLSVERTYNGTVTAGVWQTTTLSDTTSVWQTTAGFCDHDTRCTFAEFKAQYPDAVLLGLTVAIGSGVPALTSYVDGVSLTVDGATDTWNFELAAAPTPRPTNRPQPTTPPTDVATQLTASPLDGGLLIVLGALASVAAFALTRRPSRRIG